MVKCISFSLFIVFSARSLCNFQETDLTIERDSCGKLVGRGQAKQGLRERKGMYFRVPCEEHPVRVPYFWVPRNKCRDDREGLIAKREVDVVSPEEAGSRHKTKGRPAWRLAVNVEVDKN